MQNRIASLVDDDKIVLKIVDESLAGLNKNEYQLNLSILYFLRFLVTRNRKSFHFQKPLLKRILRKNLEILKSTEDNNLRLEAGKLYTVLLRQEHFDITLFENTNLGRFLCYRSHDFLVNEKFNTEIKETSLQYLQRLLPGLPNSSRIEKITLSTAKVCLQLLKKDDYPKISLNAANLLVTFVKSKLPIVVDNNALLNAIGRQCIIMLDSKAELAQIQCSYLLLQMSQQKLPNLLDNRDLIIEIVDKYLSIEGNSDGQYQVNLIRLVQSFLTNRPELFRPKSDLLTDIIEHSVKLATAYQNPFMVGESTKLFRITFKLINGIIDDDYKDKIVKSVADIGFRMMSEISSDLLCKKGCKLIETFIQCELAVIRDDSLFCNAVARQAVVLLKNEDRWVRNRASTLLLLMAEKRVVRFLDDKRLLQLARSESIEIGKQ